jgi:hypothetical protein
MMGTVQTPETSHRPGDGDSTDLWNVGKFYQSTRPYNPEDSHLRVTWSVTVLVHAWKSPVAAKWATALGLSREGGSRASHLHLYVSKLPFLFIMLPQFALCVYFYLRPTTMKEELRKFSMKVSGE